MPSEVGKSRFAAIAARVRQQTWFYDRKSKHLRFDGEQIFLHRGFESLSAAARQARREQRNNSGAAIFDALRADYGDATAERIFTAVTRSPLAQQDLTLDDFDRIAQEVEALGPARTDAVLNGVAQQPPLPANTPQAIGKAVNRGIVAQQQDPQGPEWRSATAAQEDLRRNFAGSMLKELGKADITLNGVPLSSREDSAGERRYRLPQAGDLSRLRAHIEEQAGVSLADMKTLSLVLNRGLLYSALDQINRRAAVAFSPQPGTPELEIHCQALPGRPGRYHFSARLRQPLRYVADPKDPDVADRLDPAKSHYEITLKGTVDCGDETSPVAVDDAQLSYAGVVAG